MRIEDSDICQCSFLDDDYEENLNACHCGEGEMDYIAFPDIKQYEIKTIIGFSICYKN